MSLTMTYLDLQEKFTGLYGDRTLVLMQSGLFYDAFEYDPANCAISEQMISKHRPNKSYNKKIGNAIEAGEKMDVLVTFQNNKAPYSIDNPNKIGFQMLSYEKRKKVLLRNDFVIIRVDQIDPKEQIDRNDPELILYGNIARRVVEIVSPATELTTLLPPTLTNNIISIYIEYQKGSKSLEDFVLTCGVSSLDVTTGECKACELFSKTGDNIYAIQEIYRLILTQQPREIIINVDGLPSEQIGDGGRYGPYARFLRKRLELDKCTHVSIRCNQVDPTYLKLDYQRQFFQKVFFQKSIRKAPPNLTINGIVLSIRQEPLIKNSSSLGEIFSKLGMERMSYGRISLLLLLQYCHEHGEKTIQNIKLPKIDWIDSNRHLILAYNAIKQLNVFSDQSSKGSISSLLDVINLTSTRSGYRILHERLFNPITNVDQLNWSYNMISEMIKTRVSNEHEPSKSLVEIIGTDLKGLPDLERYQRKLTLGVIRPKEFVILYRAYVKVTQLYIKIYSHGGVNLKRLLFSPEVTSSFNLFLKRVTGLFDIDKLETCTIKTGNKEELFDFYENPLLPGTSPRLSQLQDKLSKHQSHLDRICAHLNSFITTRRGEQITYHRKGRGKKNNLNGTSIIITAAKARKLQENLDRIDVNICGNLQFVSINSRKIVHSNVIERLTTEVEECKTQLRTILLNIYHDFLTEAVRDYNFYQPLIKFVGTLDFVKSAAKTAIKYKYYHPVIVSESSEKREEEEEEVKGKGKVEVDQSFLEVTGLRHPIIERIIDHPYIANDLNLGLTQDGILLYGANSTGKSSLTKALGLMIIMAQAGLYTAGKLRYKPYHKIITRLSGHDDLTKGQSSFVIEMEELRIILCNADHHTLVLGDELCRGTESRSGTGLTVSTLEELVKRKSSFIFSTHMHHLSKMEVITRMNEKLKIYHLGIKYDSNLEDLVIDRKIKRGSGSTTYGIEIAKSMGLDGDFIRRAMEISRMVEGDDNQILSTKTSHYNRKLYKTGCLLCGSKLGIDTHHLVEQHKADSNGLIGHVSKDILSNLTHLCKKCHQLVHREGVSLEKKETLSGSVITAKLENSNHQS